MANPDDAHAGSEIEGSGESAFGAIAERPETFTASRDLRVEYALVIHADGEVDAPEVVADVQVQVGGAQRRDRLRVNHGF